MQAFPPDASLEDRRGEPNTFLELLPMFAAIVGLALTFAGYLAAMAS